MSDYGFKRNLEICLRHLINLECAHKTKTVKDKSLIYTGYIHYLDDLICVSQ